MAKQLSLIQDLEYPPALFNLETEAAFLGALMSNNSFVDQAAERVGVLDFSSELHQRIYQSILSEVSAGRHASPPLLRNQFIGDPEYEQAGGFDYLSEMTAAKAGIIGIWSFAAQVVDLAKRRRLLDEMRTLQGDLVAITDHPVEQLVEQIDSALAAALQRTETTRSMTFARAFDHTMQAIEDEAAGVGPQGIHIEGLPDFNELTGDLRRGEVMILGGRPSMGKTAVAGAVALGAARAGFGTLFVSLEMSVEQLLTRAITDLLFKPGNSPTLDQVKRGKFSVFDRERIKEARAKVEAWPLIITDPATLGIGRLAMMIRRYQRQMAGRGQNLDLVIIDYLGLVRASGKGKNRYEDMGEVSRTLKQVAKECDVALLVLAQLNRECEKRDDKRPMLSDLRDAGDIEQDADVVMFVYREEYYLERTEPDASDVKKYAAWDLAMRASRDRIELITAKVRQGKIGKRLCYFFGAHQAVRGSRFYEERYDD